MITGKITCDKLTVIIGITGWFALARIVRSEVRQIRNSDYVMYARLCGGSFGYVMYHHLIPNFVSAIMFVVISSISSCITMESTLSFLGLGLPANLGMEAELGIITRAAREIYRQYYPNEGNI